MANTATDDPTRAARKGIELCRKGDWRRGFSLLVAAAESEQGTTGLPGLFYSYLGYGMARYRNRVRDGLALCEHAIKIEFYQPESYLNLARTRLLMHDRTGAIQALDRGLKIDPGYGPLLELRDQMGVRRPAVVPFLSRGNPLNHSLGWLRSRLSQRHR